MKYINETSKIDENVSIGKNTKIWHWTHISSGSTIGENCTLGQNVFIGNNVIIGNGVKIQNNVSIFDGVEIEDDVFCGPSVVFTNVSNPRSFISRKNEYVKTKVCTGASIGANSTIICGIVLSQYCFIGAGSVVTKNVKKFEKVFGNPGIHRGWVTKEGDSIIFNNNEYICSTTKKKYVLYEEKNEVELEQYE